jgi:hypothetical protein
LGQLELCLHAGRELAGLAADEDLDRRVAAWA